MQIKLIWTSIEDIAIELFEAEPQLDPLTLRFTELIDKVMALPGFEGERDKCNEKILEAIQMAWLEEFQDES
jgi:FeS assembly protein IscX